MSRPAAAGGREKLGQRRRRKDKMAAAQAEVRRCRARAGGAGKGRGSGSAILEPGRRQPGRKAGPPCRNRAGQSPGARPGPPCRSRAKPAAGRDRGSGAEGAPEGMNPWNESLCSPGSQTAAAAAPGLHREQELPGTPVRGRSCSSAAATPRGARCALFVRKGQETKSFRRQLRVLLVRAVRWFLHT